MAAGELEKYVCRGAPPSSAAAADPDDDDANGDDANGGAAAASEARPAAPRRARAARASGGGDDGEAASSPPTAARVAPTSCGSVRRVGASGRAWVACELTSIERLLAAVRQRSHRQLHALFAGHVYVGRVDSSYVLLPPYQAVRRAHRRGSLARLLLPAGAPPLGQPRRAAAVDPAPIEQLCLLALATPQSGWREADGDRGALARKAAGLLVETSEMLAEYLSLEIDGDGRLVSLPQLVDGYVPPLNVLPNFVWRLATKVDWTAEQPCFDGLATELAAFYRVARAGRPPTPPRAPRRRRRRRRDGRASAESEAFTVLVRCPR